MSIAALYRAYNVQIVDYPLEASIRSAMEFCDEACVVVGQSEDDTVGIVRHLQDEYGADRLKFECHELKFDRMWQVQACELAKAMTKCDWLFLIDADEVFHEDDAGRIKDCLHWPRPVKLVSFPYYHYYASPSWYVKPGGLHFYQRHTKLGHRSVKFRLQNFRTDRNRAPVCDVMATVGGRDVKAHIFNGHEIYHSDIRVHHYGWCKLPKAQAIRRVIGDGWYTNDSRYFGDQVPELNYEHNYAFEKNKAGLLRTKHSHPTHIEQYWFDEEHHKFWSQFG